MDPITIALGLSQFVPKIVKWIAGDKAGTVAQKVIDVAQQVTGKPTGDQALAALQADPSLVLQYQKAILEQEVTFEQLAVQNAADINKTMQTEAASEHWPTYSWRPFIGFCFGALGLLSGGTVAVAYIGVMFFHRDATLLGSLPGMLGAEAGVMFTMAPVLGIASWFRGKMQADPSIPTNNKG
jgi:hypothetical protein